MSDTAQTVFVSYRRSVSSFIARAVFNDLVHHGFDVFMDVESIDAGTFDIIIRSQIAARAHFLVILTPGSVERFMQPEDWLRREIEYAIDLQRNIIPVLVNGFSFDAHTAYFTGKLAEPRRYNAITLYHEYFDEAMARLGVCAGLCGARRGAIADLEQYLDLRDEPPFVRRMGVVKMIYTLKEAIGDTA